MNYAVILSGGIGTRMRDDGFPKQYLESTENRFWCTLLRILNPVPNVDKIIVVAHENWVERIQQWAQQYGIHKLAAFATPGKTRQHSLLNGLLVCEKLGVTDDDIVLVHDGVRPLVPPELLSACIDALPGYDAVLPVVSLKDTIYYSECGELIDSQADRSKLFGGQSPEAFRLKPYLALNRNTDDEKLTTIRGSSELAFQAGWKIRMIPGDERNFKLTTPDDVLRLSFYIEYSRKQK